MSAFVQLTVLVVLDVAIEVFASDSSSFFTAVTVIKLFLVVAKRVAIVLSKIICVCKKNIFFTLVRPFSVATQPSTNDETPINFHDLEKKLFFSLSRFSIILEINTAKSIDQTQGKIK